MSNLPDDKNMVPEWCVDQIMENELSVDTCTANKREFISQEPDAAEYMELLIAGDLDKLEQAFPELQHIDKFRPTMKFLFWKCINRGWFMGNAKWKTNFLRLPGESKEKNPNHYTPESDDFI